MNWPLTAVAQAFLDGDRPMQPWAAESAEGGTPIANTDFLNLGGTGLVDATEDPVDTSYRRAILGEAIEFETEEIRGVKAGHLEVRRQVMRRLDPLEFGPLVRVQACETETIEIRDEDGSPVFDRRGLPKTRELITGRKIFSGPESAMRRAFPDEIERSRRSKVGIYGGVRRKLFLIES